MTKFHRGPGEGEMEDPADKSALVSLDGQVLTMCVINLTLDAFLGFWEPQPLSWKASNSHNVPLCMAQDIWRMCDIINEKTLNTHAVHRLANSILREHK